MNCVRVTVQVNARRRSSKIMTIALVSSSTTRGSWGIPRGFEWLHPLPWSSLCFEGKVAVKSCSMLAVLNERLFMRWRSSRTDGSIGSDPFKWMNKSQTKPEQTTNKGRKPLERKILFFVDGKIWRIMVTMTKGDGDMLLLRVFWILIFHSDDLMTRD